MNEQQEHDIVMNQISLEQQASAWNKIWELCLEIGMNIDTTKSGEENVLDYITSLRYNV